MGCEAGSLADKYELVKEIGQGGGGKVYLAHEAATQDLVAVKVLNVKDPASRKSLESEIRIGMKLGKNSPFLLQYKDVVEKGDDFWLVMEYCEKGDISEEIQERAKSRHYFSNEELVEMIYEIGVALKFLHGEGIVHKDLKPQNLFQTKNNLKLGDYGICRQQGQTTTMPSGTVGYMAVEVLDGSTFLCPFVPLFPLEL